MHSLSFSYTSSDVWLEHLYSEIQQKRTSAFYLRVVWTPAFKGSVFKLGENIFHIEIYVAIKKFFLKLEMFYLFFFHFSYECFCPAALISFASSLNKLVCLPGWIKLEMKYLQSRVMWQFLWKQMWSKDKRYYLCKLIMKELMFIIDIGQRKREEWEEGREGGR